MSVADLPIHRTEVDHVTTVWTEAPAPLQAALLFRIGRIDETLATSGQAHLIEHMSLSAIGDSPQHNGFVGGVVTGFYTRGRDHEVSKVLASICEALTSLPGERLESEKQVLAAESAARPYDFRGNLLTWRYGAAGYGLFGLPELGLRAATLGQLRDLASKRFTSDNAVLWLSGPIPNDLRLKLPRGIKYPTPNLEPVQQPLPSWFLDDKCGGVAAGTVIFRSCAAVLFCEIASRRLRKQLRTDLAVSYAPSVSYDPLDAAVAHLVIHADSDQSRRSELVQNFAEVFQGLSDVEDEECNAARNQILEYYTGSLAPPVADMMVLEVQRAAMDWIMGDEFEPLGSIVPQYKSTTTAEASSIGRDLKTKALFALPGGVSLVPCFGNKAPDSKWPLVKGRKASHVDAPIRREELVYGPEGVSLISADGSHCTVRFSDLAAVLCYEDGAIRPVGTDAASVMVEPTLWRDGKSICSKIREQVPAHLVIDQYPRPANTIPRPTTTAWQRFLAKL